MHGYCAEEQRVAWTMTAVVQGCKVGCWTHDTSPARCTSRPPQNWIQLCIIYSLRKLGVDLENKPDPFARYEANGYLNWLAEARAPAGAHWRHSMLGCGRSLDGMPRHSHRSRCVLRHVGAAGGKPTAPRGSSMCGTCASIRWTTALTGAQNTSYRVLDCACLHHSIVVLQLPAVWRSLSMVSTFAFQGFPDPYASLPAVQRSKVPHLQMSLPCWHGRRVASLAH